MMKTTQRGFTLIELMIIIAIIAILAVIAYPSYQNYIRQARMEDARAVMMGNIQVMERHYSQKNTFCVTPGTKKNSCATFPVLSKTATRFYDLKVETALSDADNFVLSATPKQNVYSDSTLASVPLAVHYSSLNGGFFKCKKGVEIGAEQGCEIF